MCKTKEASTVEVRLTLWEWEKAPAVAAYWLTTREEMRMRFAGGIPHAERFTESLELAMEWIDQGHNARLVKCWRLPNGLLALKDPRTASVAAVKPYTVP